MYWLTGVRVYSTTFWPLKSLAVSGFVFTQCIPFDAVRERDAAADFDAILRKKRAKERKKKASRDNAGTWVTFGNKPHESCSSCFL
jgi:hypothetical protein